MTSLIRYARITISELLEGWETRHRGALLRSLVRWWTAAGSVGRHRTSVAALRSLLLSGALGTWYTRRDERSVRRETAIELAAALNTALEMLRVLRLGFAIDAWLAQHEAESARRARLDGRALLLWSERARVAILAAWRTWRTRAHASSRANRWLTLADGHRILQALGCATPRWRTLQLNTALERRRGVVFVRPSPSPHLVRPLSRAPPATLQLNTALALPDSRSPSRSPPPRSPPPPQREYHYCGAALPTNPVWSRQPRPLPPWRPPDLSGGDLLDRLVVMHQLLGQPALSPPALSRAAALTVAGRGGGGGGALAEGAVGAPAPFRQVAAPLAPRLAQFRHDSDSSSAAPLAPRLAPPHAAPAQHPPARSVDSLRASFAGELLLHTAAQRQHRPVK